jgi:magnesium transporter
VLYAIPTGSSTTTSRWSTGSTRTSRRSRGRSPHAGTNPAERIYLLKREVIEFHQAAVPLTEPLDRLVHSLVPGMHGELGEYFRDIQDHLLRVVDNVNGFRELLTSVLQANLTQVALRQSEIGRSRTRDMRKISAWVASWPCRR